MNCLDLYQVQKCPNMIILIVNRFMLSMVLVNVLPNMLEAFLPTDRQTDRQTDTKALLHAVHVHLE